MYLWRKRCAVLQEHLESSAAEKENSYNDRVEWDDYITVDYNKNEKHMKTEHYGSGSRNVTDFDNAWEVFNDYCSDPDYKRVRLIQIDSNGVESVYARK